MHAVIASPVLVIVRGWPGSGKSTLVKRLLSQLHHLEADQFLYKPDGSYHYTPAKGAAAHKTCVRKVTDLLKQKENVVVANCMSNTRGVKDYLKIAYKAGARVAVIECSGNYKNKHGMSRSQVEKVRMNFQRLAPYLRGALPVIDGAKLFTIHSAERHVLACAKPVYKSLITSKKTSIGGWPGSQVEQFKAVLDHLPEDVKADIESVHPSAFVTYLRVNTDINNLPVTLIFDRKLFGGFAYWLMCGIKASPLGIGKRRTSLASLSDAEKKEEMAVRKEEKKLLEKTSHIDREQLKKRQKSNRNKRISAYEKKREETERSSISSYSWINSRQENDYQLGFPESGGPADVANDLLAIINTVNQSSMEEGGKELKANALFHHQTMYGELTEISC